MSLKSNWETLVTCGDGAALATAARVSALPSDGIITIDPNFFDVIGKMLIIRAHGRISSVITTPGTARYDVNFLNSAAANVIVFDGLAVLLDTVAGHTNVGWELEIRLRARAIGAAGNLFGHGRWSCEDILGVPATAPKGVLSAILPWNAAPAVGANFDTTLAQTIDLRFTQTVATGSMTLHGYELISPN